MNADKFKALVHFIVHECQDNPERLGSVRLHKALWFTDMIHYHQTAQPVTGAIYVKKPRGPVAAVLYQTLLELEADGVLKIQGEGRLLSPWEYISLKKPVSNALSQEEMDLARSVLDVLSKCTAEQVAEMSHDDAWYAARMNEEIPLHATLVTEGDITEDVVLWADSVIEARNAGHGTNASG